MKIQVKTEVFRKDQYPMPRLLETMDFFDWSNGRTVRLSSGEFVVVGHTTESTFASYAYHRMVYVVPRHLYMSINTPGDGAEDVIGCYIDSAGECRDVQRNPGYERLGWELEEWAQNLK